MKFAHSLVLVATVAVASAAASTQPARQERIPVATLAPAVSVSRDVFKLVITARELPNGRVLVNDAMGNRLVVLDSMMKTVRVVFDTIAGADNFYGSGPRPILPYPGDSSVFVDGPSKSLILLDPSGNVVRTIAAPGDRDLFLVAAAAGGLDDRGRLLYRGLAMRSGAPKPGETGLSVALNGAAAPTSNADSNPIVRADYQTRAVDTVAVLKSLNAQRGIVTTDANGAKTWTTLLNPRPIGDEWTVVSDGTIAIVRGQDYHIDWITSSGTMSSTPKLPFDWKRIDEAEKLRLYDSTRTTMSRIDTIQREMTRQQNTGGAAMSGRSGGAAGADRPAFVMPLMKSTSVPISEIPDYEPSIRQGAVVADRDNNVWILPSTSAQSLSGELVYDVINRKGVLFERVRLPVGRSIVGFGRGGVVYLMHGTLKTGFQLERTRILSTGSKQGN